jgi:hypothetical protein
MFRWRHVQAVVRLLQVVHVLSDVIPDWDAIMDCFEQLVMFMSSNRSQFHEDVTSHELEKIGAAIDRFKIYSIFLSDEALVRVMAALVALSLNSLAVSSSSQTTPTITSNNNMNMNNNTNMNTIPLTRSTSSNQSNTISNQSNLSRNTSNASDNMNRNNNIGNNNNTSINMSDSRDNNDNNNTNNMTSFPLLIAVEITKLNAYRVACIWQLMTSHLRMVAAHKVQAILYKYIYNIIFSINIIMLLYVYIIHITLNLHIYVILYYMYSISQVL